MIFFCNVMYADPLILDPVMLDAVVDRVGGTVSKRQIRHDDSDNDLIPI